ncbi:MAG: phosphoribosylanthranilate isomerase [Candidatus Limivivens sp.]|nr:phosphoribosylanthranilate isomerase [Candidatus Limivivens sp.]
MTKIKICGLSRECDIEYANACRPDYIGFVFAKSRRQTAPETARRLRKRLNPDIIPVGVFVNAPAAEVLRLLKDGVIAMAQLHGQESPEEILEIQETSGCPVIKAFSVRTKADLIQAAASPADYLLFDYGAGGTGQRFDWSLFQETEGLLKKPFFLAGGIRTDNVEEAVRTVHPFAVDVSSGAETEGVKDPAKMFELVRRIRNGER